MAVAALTAMPAPAARPIDAAAAVAPESRALADAPPRMLRVGGMTGGIAFRMPDGRNSMDQPRSN